MKRILILAAAAAFTLTLAQTVPAQDASPFVGVWLLERFDRCKAADTSSCVPFYGVKPVGSLIITKSGLYFGQGYADYRVSPKTPNPTDEERIALHKSMYSWGGKYKFDGNKISVDITYSWNQQWTGTTRAGGVYKVEGNKLLVTSEPFKSTVDGEMIVTKVAFNRAE